MTYTEFLRNIDKYVGYVVEFKSRFKSNGQEYTFNDMFGITRNLGH